MEFYVNGKRHYLEAPRPELTLLQYLRSSGLTGTKLGCAEGGCGACTVLVSSYNKNSQKIEHYSVNACLAPLCSVQDKHVITVEGIGSSQSPHPVQERIAAYFGSQCGFCTPGIVMSLYALLRNNPEPSSHAIEEAFDGNLCRCTGYRPILDAAKSFCPMGDACCKNAKTQMVGTVDGEISAKKPQFKSYEPSQDIIFPPALINRLNSSELNEVSYIDDVCSWYRPVTLEQLAAYKADHPDAKIVCGNTEVGIETKFKNQLYKKLVYPMEIKQLMEVEHLPDGVKFGACLTLTRFMEELKLAVKTYGPQKSQSFQALLDNLKWFAGNQIRNVATIAGNIVTASPISDMNPIFVATKSELEVLQHGKGARKIMMDEFFLGYRKTALNSQEVVLSIFIPFTNDNEHVMAYKQAKRRDDDIAIVTTCLRVKFDSQQQVSDCGFAFGGMGPITLGAKKAQDACLGKSWNSNLLESVTELLTNTDLLLQASSPGGMIEYRRALAASLFFKFFVHVQSRIGVEISEVEKSILEPKTREISRATQVIAETEGKQSVGKVGVHLSALKQTTGEAIYTDDVRKFHGELYASPVMSSKAHAKILSIDTADALKVKGVRAFISAKDVPNSNLIGPVFKDEELFATEVVHHVGQMIGLIVGEDYYHTQKSAKLVKVQYEELHAVLTIEEAIEKRSFYDIRKEMKRGDIDLGLKQSDHVIEGEVRVGGQNHFYLETQASIAIPKWEGDEMEIISSTQNPTETQHLVAHVLGIHDSKVVCKVKRMGGGFGGKETRSAVFGCALAVAAKKLGAPVRCMLDRDEDMVMCGQRHPFLGKYKAGFTKEGKLIAYEVLLYSNAGYSADLSIAVMERAVSHSDNVYFIPNIRAFGTVCRTNIHSNTAFRGFGGPQGMLITETMINHVSEHLNIPVHQIREMNMYKEGQMTHFNQPLEDFNVFRLWKEIMKSSDYISRRAAIQTFNSKNKYKKRGIALLPTKFGIAFTARFLNQAGALVHVYADGSVLVTHAGTEMGQGLHTKMAQIAADVFKIPVSQVHISETATDKVPNTPPTAASAGSDLNGMAVLDACNQIMERLIPYREEQPNKPLKVYADLAYKDRVNLSANGFYKTPDLSYDWSTNSGRMFNYFTFGVAVSEVEMDSLTGDFQIIRSDILMDLGTSMNPGVDIGQIEGAFVQGAGWSTIEETVFFPNGHLFTRGPGNYKIPGFTDIPIEFNVKLLSECKNVRAVHSSKAVGEPPLFLGSSVYFALRDAIKSHRESQGLGTGYFRLDAPATPERIRMACEDRFTKLSRSIARKDGEKDWCIRV